MRLVAGCPRVSADPGGGVPVDPAFGEVYNCRERWFVGLLGNDAGWLHAGRPRREAARIALRLALRTQVAELTADAAGFAAAVAGVAEHHAETWMPDQTYLQQAQVDLRPLLLSFAFPALRDAGAS